MPKKKGKTKKKGAKSGKKKLGLTPDVPKEPMAPDYVAQPLKPGERLIKMLTSHPVDEKEIHGMKVTSRVLNELTPQEIRDLRVVFDIFDTNCDGFIGPLELRRALKALGFKVTKEQAKRLIQDVSLKGKPYIDFNEFLETVMDRQNDSRDIYGEILSGFKMFDLENKGAISLENLKKSCQDAGIKFNQKDLEEMIEEADVNGDGQVDQSEFIRIMLKTNLF